MITFTGSVETGRAIRAAAGLKKVTLELGGNSAVIIEPDADLDAAVTRVVQGGYGLQRAGLHLCAAGLRSRGCRERFPRQAGCGGAEAARRASGEDSTQIASLISEDAAARVENWTQEAVSAGAKLLTGGERSHATQSRPGVLADVPENSTFMRNELFGPLVAVNRYSASGRRHCARE